MQDYWSLAIVGMAVNISINTLGTTPSGMLKEVFGAYNQRLPNESRIPLVNSYITIIHIIQKILSMGGRDRYITTRIVKARLTWVNLYLETNDAGYVCRKCGISRPTLRKWYRRYVTDGEKGLFDKSKKT